MLVQNNNSFDILNVSDTENTQTVPEQSELNVEINQPEFKEPQQTESSVQPNQESQEVVHLEIRGFDPVTGEETIESQQQLDSELGSLGLETESFEGLLEILNAIETPEDLESEMLDPLDDFSQTESVFGDDQRTLVSDTLSDPFSRIGFIRMELNGTWYGGSGAMISPYHFLTAGHNIYDSDDGGWADQAYVTLGQDGTKRPYGEARVTYFHSVTGWTNDEDANYDWAIVTLDRNLGDFSGWMGMRSRNDSYFDDLNVTTAGYPGDLASGWNSFSTGGQTVEMYQASGPIQTTSQHQLFYNNTMDTAGGQSGSPVWVNEANGPYIVGVHAYGDGGNGYNEATRMQSYMIDLYHDWKSTDDSVRSPVDKPDLADYDTWMDTDFADISSGSISVGDHFDISSVIRNIGTATSGNFTVNFYASTDNDVTNSLGSHYLIGTSNVSSITPFDWEYATWNGTFPNIPEGNYSVVAFIDPTTSIDEFDDSKESNQFVIDSLNVLGEPDLSGYYFDIVQEPLEAGDSFDVSFEVENTGDGDAGGFYVDFYLSTDSTISTSDHFLGYHYVSGLTGESTTGNLSKNLTLPAVGDGFWQDDQTYYVGMLVDALDSVDESNEGNNNNVGWLWDYDDVDISKTSSETNQPPTYNSQFFPINGDYTPIPGDFNGDGNGDVIWYRPGAAADYLWTFNSDGSYNSQPFPVNGDYTPIPGDFNGDGNGDVIWYRPGAAADYLWTFNSDGSYNSQPFPVNGDYTPIPGDFNGDGTGDVIWYRPGAAADYLWTFNSDGSYNSQPFPINGDYTPIPGDFNGDGTGDVIWYRPGAAADYLWTFNSDGSYNSQPFPINGDYTPIPGDFDGNNHTDVLWYQPGAGSDYLWSFE